MKTYILDVIPRIKKYSKQLDDLKLLTEKNWVLIDTFNDLKRVFIFRRNKELIISSNGFVEKGYWEFLSKDSLLIEADNTKLLFRHGFIDENILALKLDSNSEYALFVNENNNEYELNSLDAINSFLKRKYLFGYASSEIKDNHVTKEKEKSEFGFGTLIAIIAFILLLCLGLYGSL